MSNPTGDVSMDGTGPADQNTSGDVAPAQLNEVVSSAHAPPIASEDPSNAAPGGGPKTARKIAGKGTAKNGARSGNAPGSGDAGSGKFKPGDIVLTKLKGFPLWPSVVVSPDDIPAEVLFERPKASNIYCTMFFPDGNYAWSAPRDLTLLKAHDIASYLQSSSKKAEGALFKGYKIAQDPDEFIQEKLEAVKAAAAYQGASEDEDELEEEQAEDEGAGKKRKRADKKEAPAKKTKAAKEPKSKKAVKEEDEDETEEPVAKKKAKAAPKPKKEKTEKAEPAPKDEEPEDDDPLSKNPDAVKVKEWRHKLQRAFLTKHDLPSAAEMPAFDELFKTIEDYQDMTVEYLSYSKLGKVMKKIAALPNIVSNDEYKLTDRALKLMNNWSKQASGGVSETVAKVAETASEVKPGEAITNAASAAVDAAGDAAEAVKEAVAPVANGIVEGAKDLVNGAAEQMQVDEKEPEAPAAAAE